MQIDVGELHDVLVEEVRICIKVGIVAIPEIQKIIVQDVQGGEQNFALLDESVVDYVGNYEDVMCPRCS